MEEGGNADGDHLAVMARAGLMTHVAELAPPVTAEAMARFRADAARQASNVIALASGRFALCLPPGRREVDTGIAHRLLPIGATGEARGATAEAGGAVPRRILPPSLRGPSAQPAPRPGGDPDRAAERAQGGSRAKPAPAHRPSAPSDAAGAAPSGPPSVSHPPACSAPPDRAPVSPAARPDPVPAAEPPAPAQPRGAAAAAVEREESAVEEATMPDRALHAIANRLEAAARAAPDPAEIEAALGRAVSAAIGDLEARLSETISTGLSAAEARLSEGLEAAHGAQAEALGDLRRAVEALGHAQADESARLTEGLATLRLGLRAVNDRLAELEAPGPAPARAEDARHPVPEAADPGASPSGAGHADADGAGGSERGEMHGAVQALLGRLDWLEAGATAAAGRPDTPVWRRSPRALRNEAG